ncbi:TetR/AcrR family transcriptional regulator [Marivita hallyeonensis]|uniref:Transcriptional regulator, TetR family n=1 Tax=Marivita hallyeonensis TaxID=996342 RepID=A0A1M5TEN7_9RHOB|nr:TetR/AcrR family transcriptional regulator [Marivita hallyeonensis]SHH49178.1 transcriptional regulator, TetR family [Marivita hallyeonensis]
MTTEASNRPVRRTAKDIRREETRARLLDAAKNLFAEHDYDSVTVTEIAREAGVTHGMINVYFGGKPGLLYEIIRQTNALQYDDTLNVAAEEDSALKQLERTLFSWIDGDTEDTRLLAVMQSYSWVWPSETELDNQTVRSGFKAVIAKIVSNGSGSGEFRSSLDPHHTARSIWAIYTWGIRAAIFQGATALECHTEIMLQVRQLVLADP